MQQNKLLQCVLLQEVQQKSLPPKNLLQLEMLQKGLMVDFAISMEGMFVSLV